jgi:hypothetical protein
MTIPEWKQLVDTLYDACLNNIKLLGQLSRDDVDGYLSFYGVHDAIYVSKKGKDIVGIATTHPGVGDFNWKWRRTDGTWTIHLAWSKQAHAVPDMFNQFFERKSPIKQVWAWRQDHAVQITPRKLERLLYGRK